MSTVTEVADDYLRSLAELDPQAAQALGRTPELLFPDLSPDGFAARAELARSTRGRAAAADAAGPGEPALRAALVERLGSDIDLYDEGFTTRLLAPLATPVHLTRQVFDVLPSSTEDDWAGIARHLRALPNALRQYEATLRDSAKHGNRVSRRQILAVAKQCSTWIGPDDFYGTLVARYPGHHLTGELAAAAGMASAATGAFAEFLRADLASDASTVDGVGRETYAVTSRAFLGAEVDLDELYEYGWKSLTDTAAEMRAVAAELGYPDTAAAIAALHADPAWRVPVGAPLEAWLRTRLAEITDALAGTHFDIPAPVRHVDCRISPAAAGVMYYTPPDPALTRAGAITWTVPPGVDSVPVWQDVATLCHEGLPGHHMQYAITFTTAHLHPWQRSQCHVHGYAEGWAHYAERLADELGLYRNPAERLGMLSGQMWRAARIVIDMGLHLAAPIPADNGFTDATRWRPEMAVEFLSRVAGIEPHTAGFEVDRYLGWPGQALAFKAGARLWWQAREAAEHRDGASFDLRSFHATALGLGPMGLDPLRACLAAIAPGGAR